MNATAIPAPPQNKLLGLLLALTIFLSAFLLFQVQPLISKFILPWFGGSPAVWTTAMLFFQCMLFLGYVYSHLLFSRLKMTTQVRVHIVLLLIAAVMAFFVIPLDVLKPTGQEDPTARILLLLTVCVGLPYFVLSTTGPLIQAWFSYAFPGRSPYRLFSLSNLGSLIALGTFPFLFEPYLHLQTMGRFWMLGFWCFAMLCTLSGLSVFRLVTASLEKESSAATANVNIVPSFFQRFSWVGLSSVASLMFIATTNHVCHDVATVPFLWIIPLALYLLTFIICFDHPRWYRRALWPTLCVLAIIKLTTYDAISNFLEDAITLEAAPPEFLHSWFEYSLFDNRFHLNIELGFVATLALNFGTMFLICMVCHGELVLAKPASERRITEYYLMIAGGGALGGLFITFIATNFFVEYYEWPLGLLISFCIAGGVLAIQLTRLQWFGAMSWLPWSAAVAIGAMIVFWHLDPLDWRVSPEAPGVVYRNLRQNRNFYGTVTVTERRYTQTLQDGDEVIEPKDSYRRFLSGTILHGRQYIDPERRNIPLSYYGEGSGVQRVLQYCIEESHRAQPIKYAVIGLGAGALASYARAADGDRAADECVMYEINPLVEDIARNDFWYLGDYETRVGKPIEVRLGDARLTMEREAPQAYDIIVLDAFSSDSVPAHLLTKEAFEIYQKHLKKKPDGSLDGFICLHITNRYLNLYPIVKNAAVQVLKMPYTSIYAEGSADLPLLRNHYFIITNNQDFLSKTPPVPRFRLEVAPGSEVPVMKPVDYDWPNIPLWTDHYSTIFNVLLNE